MCCSLLVAVVQLIAHARPTLAANVGKPTEIPVERSAPLAQGHPLTTVVVTQCNLIVAVYMTMARSVA